MYKLWVQLVKVDIECWRLRFEDCYIYHPHRELELLGVEDRVRKVNLTEFVLSFYFIILQILFKE